MAILDPVVGASGASGRSGGRDDGTKPLSPSAVKKKLVHGRCVGRNRGGKGSTSKGFMVSRSAYSRLCVPHSGLLAEQEPPGCWRGLPHPCTPH